MTNIGVIKTIEAKTASGFDLIDHQAASANFDCKRTKNSQGYSYDHSLTFKMAGFSEQNEAALLMLSRAESVRITDVNGYCTVIGDADIRLEVTWEDSIDGNPGSFRGHKIKVVWISSRRAPIKSFI